MGATFVIKRNGQKTSFDESKIVSAINKAYGNVYMERPDAQNLAEASKAAKQVVELINSTKKDEWNVEEVQDTVEKVVSDTPLLSTSLMSAAVMFFHLVATACLCSFLTSSLLRFERPSIMRLCVLQDWLEDRDATSTAITAARFSSLERSLVCFCAILWIFVARTSYLVTLCFNGILFASKIY